MTKETADVLYVPELALKLGKTEAAIRQGLSRGADWIPPAFKMGSRIAWRLEDVDRFIEEKSKNHPTTTTPKE